MERLSKVMANRNVASRRKCEELIAAGRVQVNGRVIAEQGVRVDPGRDRIEADGCLVSETRRLYILLHKPPGWVSTAKDPQGRPTVVELVSINERLYPAGRLDMNSEGLLLLTNDGALTERLTHPRYEHEREYWVEVEGRPSDEAILKLRDGVELEDGRTWPASVGILSDGAGRSRFLEGEGDRTAGTWLRITIHEGRKRQVRRMCEAVGYPVRRLIRVRMGPLLLGKLARGEWRYLTRDEVKRLRRAVGLEQVDRNRRHVGMGMRLERESLRVSTVAVDGPAASGKSTIGALLAELLGYLYFDTGVMYRAVTLVALRRHLAISDETAVTKLAEEVDIVVSRPIEADGRQYTVLANGDDITWDIRRPEVDWAVSPVSAYPGVRRALTMQQRRIGEKGCVVMVGRDIGTVVMPDADLKIYLSASAEERARRRHVERLARGQESDYDEVLRDMRRRDKIDSGRKTAPLKAAEDAVVVDSTFMSIEDVLVHAKGLVMERSDRMAAGGGLPVECE